MISRSMISTLIAMVVGGLPACGGDDTDDGAAPSNCVERDATACTPLYEPTWDRVFSETLQPSCGVPGGACHGDSTAIGASGGFLITDMDATHDMLLNGGWVEAGDEQCSPLMFRLDTDETSLLMPPGSQPLDENERCSVAQWIAQGANR
ncbi:MAG: hypothetical protein AAF799_39900 [Myxococcota bacterium]